MPAITDTLSDIDIWLADNAPVDWGNLFPPADDRDIAQAEATFGRTLPAEIRALYQWHDGSPATPASCVELLPGWPFLSLEASASHWAQRNKLYESDLDETGACFWWRTSWMPLAYDFTGDMLVAEISPEATNSGAVFHASLENGPRFFEGWPTLTAALDDVADALAADDPQPLRGLTPVVDAGRLTWR
jgi:cell wall assembly regulator SMI1